MGSSDACEVVGLSGFEPELRRPKCLVLPLHHSPIQKQSQLIAGAKVLKKLLCTKFCDYFIATYFTISRKYFFLPC